MQPTRVEYANGQPKNLPDFPEQLLLYGRDGLDAEGPVLGAWSEIDKEWQDANLSAIRWHVTYFCVPPENPEKSYSEPTVANEVV